MLLIVACGGEATNTPTPSPTTPVTETPSAETPSPEVSPTAETPSAETPSPEVSPTAETPSAETPSPEVSPTAETPTALFLEITSPQDGSVVQEASVDVTGTTTPDATVTVNGEEVTLDSAGNFTATVELTVGSNTIEVIATDSQGNQERETISVEYQP